MSIVLATATTSCSIGLALSQYAEKTERSTIDIGSTRSEVEHTLGEPISQEVRDDGSLVATYREKISPGSRGNEPFKPLRSAPDPARTWPPWGRALLYFISDILTLGAMELLSTPLEVGYKVSRAEWASTHAYDIVVTYDSNSRVVAVRYE